MKKIVCTLLLLGCTFAHAGWNEATTAYEKGNYQLALKGFKPLAVQGNAGAQYNLALMYNNGKGMPQDYQQAAHWYTKAAVQGDAEAQFNLAVIYDNGIRCATRLPTSR